MDSGKREDRERYGSCGEGPAAGRGSRNGSKERPAAERSGGQTSGGDTRRIACLGLLCAAAALLGYVESLFPFFAGIPGMKLGLPNAAILMVLYLYSWREALLVNAMRILIVGFLFGNAFSIAFSAAGAAFSLLCMQLAKRSGRLSISGVSMIGGVAHNAAQVAVASAVVGNARVGYYFFPLAVSGVITGLLTGLIGGELVKRLRRALRF